jgi:hypothetical protein
MGEVGRTDQFQHCESADDVIMSIVKGSTLDTNLTFVFATSFDLQIANMVRGICAISS